MRIGIGCSFVGPLFLVCYYAWYGIGLGFIESQLFLGLFYGTTALFAMFVGLGVGSVLGRFVSKPSFAVGVLLVCCLFMICFSTSILLLMLNQLNSDIKLTISLPMFSVVCSGCTFLVTAAAKTLL